MSNGCPSPFRYVDRCVTLWILGKSGLPPLSQGVVCQCWITPRSLQMGQCQVMLLLPGSKSAWISFQASPLADLRSSSPGLLLFLQLFELAIQLSLRSPCLAGEGTLIHPLNRRETGAPLRAESLSLSGELRTACPCDGRWGFKCCASRPFSENPGGGPSVVYGADKNDSNRRFPLP